MANEISLTVKMTATKSGTSVTNYTSTKAQTMAGAAMHHTTQEVSTSEEALSVGDVDITNSTGADYIVLLRNASPGAEIITVKIKVAAVPTYFECGHMYPGEFWHSRMPKLDGSSLGGIYLISSAATGVVEVEVVECGSPV